MPKKSTKTSKALQKAGIDIPDGGGMNIATIFNKAIAKVAKTHEKDVTALDANRVAALVGIPLGHLSLEMLFTENVLALGRVMCFDGVPETCKTALLWEMCRLFHKASGDAVIMDTEKKQTESLGQSIVGHDKWPEVNYPTGKYRTARRFTGKKTRKEFEGDYLTRRYSESMATAGAMSSLHSLCLIL